MDIIKVIRIAREYYDINTYYHAMRVAAYVASDNVIPDDKREICVVIAIMHDLQEDSNFNFYSVCNATSGNANPYVGTCLDLLTKQEEDSYEKYLQKIKEHFNTYPEAYWVKLADMKDHLSETETLTDELKVKYLKALPCLL